jgi:hypothetical protein
MLHDFREIPVIDPFATLLALYEMLGPVFRDNAESLSKISWEVTHGAIDPWAVDASPVRRLARLPANRAFHLFVAPAFFTARFTTALGLRPSSSPHIEVHTCPSAMRGRSDWAFRKSSLSSHGHSLSLSCPNCSAFTLAQQRGSLCQAASL